MGLLDRWRIDGPRPDADDRKRKVDTAAADVILDRTRNWDTAETINYCDAVLLGHIGRMLVAYRRDNDADHIREAVMHLDVAGVLLDRVLRQEDAAS